MQTTTYVDTTNTTNSRESFTFSSNVSEENGPTTNSYNTDTPTTTPTTTYTTTPTTTPTTLPDSTETTTKTKKTTNSLDTHHIVYIYILRIVLM